MPLQRELFERDCKYVHQKVFSISEEYIQRLAFQLTRENFTMPSCVKKVNKERGALLFLSFCRAVSDNRVAML